MFMAHNYTLGMVVIREMTLTDLNEIEVLAEPIYFPYLWEPMDAFVRRIELYPRGCLVATSHGNIVGYLYSHPWRFDEDLPLGAVIDLPEKPDCYYFHDLAVTSAYRGQGVGFSLAQSGLSLATYPRVKLISVLNSHEFWKGVGFSIMCAVEYAPGIPGYVMVYNRPV